MQSQTRGSYHKILTSEKELTLTAKNARKYLEKYREVFPNSERNDTSIKSIWNNRHKWEKELGRKTPAKINRTPIPRQSKKETVTLHPAVVPHGMLGNKIGDLEKRMVVESRTFDEFTTKYREIYPETDRTNTNLYSIYGKRHLYKKDFTITLALPDKKKITTPATPPAVPEKDIKDLMITQNNLLAEIIQLHKETIQLNKDTYALFDELRTKKPKEP